MASARWRTRERKNSRPTPPAVPSTTARRACKSSGTTEAADASATPGGVRWLPRVMAPAGFGSKDVAPLHVRGEVGGTGAAIAGVDRRPVALLAFWSVAVLYSNVFAPADVAGAALRLR